MGFSFARITGAGEEALSCGLRAPTALLWALVSPPDSSPLGSPLEVPALGGH